MRELVGSFCTGDECKTIVVSDVTLTVRVCAVRVVCCWVKLHTWSAGDCAKQSCPQPDQSLIIKITIKDRIAYPPRVTALTPAAAVCGSHHAPQPAGKYNRNYMLRGQGANAHYRRRSLEHQWHLLWRWHSAERGHDQCRSRGGATGQQRICPARRCCHRAYCNPRAACSHGLGGEGMWVWRSSTHCF